MLVLIAVCISLCACFVESLVQPQHGVQRRAPSLQMHRNHDQKAENIYAGHQFSSRELERRSFFTTSGACIAGFGASLFLEGAYADDPSLVQTDSSLSAGDYDCLLDLPPVMPDCARLYLCRHGQTENNRLHLVQGARVDPSINNCGIEQAQRLGMTVSRLSFNSEGGVAIPGVVTHSKMRRARETAEILTSVASERWTKTTPQPKLLGQVPSLGEVDFGSLEGKNAKLAKMEMMSTFASWSIGDVDKRLAGGESGRDVLTRAVHALNGLSQTAVTSSESTIAPSVLAVSHSTYLRVLLSLVNDSPLSQAAFWKVNNGSINVVDVNIKGKTRVVNLNSGFFGGGRGLGVLPRGSSDDVDIEMPQCYLIRLNEVRHLNGMEV
jgi:broad specificity phosphatase PhoE